MPRVNFGQKFEPKGNYILHGAGQAENEDYSSFDRYVQAVGAVPSVTMTYVSPHHLYTNWTPVFKKHMDQYPNVMLMPQIGTHFNEDENRDKCYYAEIVAGKWDDEIMEMLGEFKKLYRPLFVRPGFEFNGEWNGYTDPETYKKAFIHFKKLQDQVGAKNVALLWCFNPDGKNPKGQKGDFESYYPGDEYVDWWAFDLFRIGSALDNKSQKFFRDAAAHKKPVMLAECTPFQFDIKDSQRDIRNGWFVPFFKLIQETPVIKGVCYINWDWRKYPQWKDWGDARLEMNPAIAGDYANTLRDPIWLHGFPKDQAANKLYGYPIK